MTKQPEASQTKPEQTTQTSTDINFQDPSQQLIYVRYRDHVQYNRSPALVMQPQIREAVGWLVYDCELYIILAWDRDAQPPTLQGETQKLQVWYF
jgi:hypothetical protein